MNSLRCLWIVGLLCLGAPLLAPAANSLAWKNSSDVSADVHGEPLPAVLENMARQTGWQIFVEPDAARTVDAKFSNLQSRDALKKLLGDLNYALVPATNSPAQLFIFKTLREKATQRVSISTTNAARHVANELLVKLKPGADIDAIAKSLGAKVVGRDDKLGIYKLQFADAAATEAALEKLKANSDVLAVDYNYYFEPPASPQRLMNPSVAPLSIKLNPPNDSGDPCQVTVGLIDTALQSLGSRLDAFVTKSVSVAGDFKPDPAAPTHATAMLYDLLFAASNAAQGSSSLRVVHADVYGANSSTTSWDVAMGIKSVTDNGANVLNMSLGSGGDSAILNDVIKQALARGIIIFAAAGNEPVSSKTFPAAIAGVNAVTATQGSRLAPYANFGSFVSYALPGANVVYYGNQAYVFQGTSVANALATGVAAGTKGADCLPWSQIQGAMQKKFPVPQK